MRKAMIQAALFCHLDEVICEVPAQTGSILCVSELTTCELLWTSVLSWTSLYSWASRYSNLLKSSPGSYSQSVSDSVGIVSSCLFLVFPLSVSLASLRPHCLCFRYLSQTRNCARLLIVASSLILLKSTKVNSYDNNVCDVINTRDKWGCTDQQTDVENLKQS